MNGGFAKLKKLQEQAHAFFQERGIERTDDSRQSMAYRFAHFWLLVIKSFIRNRCPVRASALAYTSLLALIPLLAVGVSITTSLLQSKGQQPIRDVINQLVVNVAPILDLKAKEGDEAAAMKREEVVEKISSFINNIQSGTLGVTSTIALIFVAIGLLRTIEAAFNDIWGVTSGRGWVASIIQYWATISLGPVILVVVLGMTSGPQFQRVIHYFRSARLVSEDIKDLPSLVTRMKQQTSNRAVAHIVSRFDHALQEDLAIYSTNTVPARAFKKELKAELLKNLNAVIDGPALYDEERFTGVALRPETKQLVGLNPKGRELERLNRMLLEDVFTGQLAGTEPPFVEGVFFQLLPFVVLSLAFGAFYQLMPYTQVQWKAALIGGIVGGTLWQLNNKLSVLYVSKAVSYSKIYGSLGIIPLFLIGMYFSWLILLFGAQVAYAFQNRQAYLQEKQTEGVNQRGREFTALRIMSQVARAFMAGEKPPTVDQLAEALGVPTKLVSQLLALLMHARLAVEVLDEETRFAPGRPLDKITAHDVILAIRTGHGQELEPHDDGLLATVQGEFERIAGVEREAAASVTLEQLIKRPTII